MGVSNNFISFVGQTKAQSSRLLDLRNTLADLQRQMATQKRADTFSGLGSDAGTVQRLRTDTNTIEKYMKNIDRVSIRTKMMSDAMTEATRIGREVANSLRMQTREGEVEIEAINTVAAENLRFLQDLMNTNDNGAYLFAGNDIKNAPVENLSTLNSNIQTEMTNWLSGAQTPTQFLNNVDALSGTDMSYSNFIQSAGDIYIKVDTSVEINYTVKANGDAFKELMRGVAMAANLKQPDPSVDIATDTEFYQIYDAIITKIADATAKLDNENFDLASKDSLMGNIRERHVKDINLLKTLLSKTEDVDTSETIVKLQAVQSQLTASYEATKVVSQLTLVNFL